MKQQLFIGAVQVTQNRWHLPIAEGAGAELFTISEFSGDIAAYDRIAFGCPAMGDEVLEESDFEPFFSNVEGTLNGKNNCPVRLIWLGRRTVDA